MKKTGIELIAQERERQIKEEGYTALHDKNHVIGELAMAGACYAMPAHSRMYRADGNPFLWPMDSTSWKPTPGDRKRELAKAGAFIAAEIDRLNALEEAAKERV